MRRTDACNPGSQLGDEVVDAEHLRRQRLLAAGAVMMSSNAGVMGAAAASVLSGGSVLGDMLLSGGFIGRSSLLAAKENRGQQPPPSYSETLKDGDQELPVLARHTAFTVKGEVVDDGVIIAAVAPPWYRILDWIVRNRDRAHELGPEVWEEMIAAAYVASGFTEVLLTRRSGDYGRDVEASIHIPGAGHIRVFDQVKAFRPGNVVTANDVRALKGIIEVPASKGFITTTSTFAPKIEEDKFLAPYFPHRLELRPRDVLFGWLEDLLNKAPL